MEAWLISAHQAFNREKGLFTDVCGYTVDMAEMFKLHSDAAADCYELYLHAPDCTYISPFLLACVPTCAMLIEMLPCLK